MHRRTVRLLVAMMLALAASVVGGALVAAPAHADGCYTWGRTLSQGMSGDDVRQLQIRVSGYPGYGGVIALDGEYGSSTKPAGSGLPQPSSRSRHLYGDAVDMGSGPHSLCTLAKQARNHGFRGILGPGFPGHNDHTHVDHRSSRYWDAPSCGI
jgi:hypothetical protein